MEPPIASLISLCYSALHLYTIWLLDRAGSETRLQTSTSIRDSLTAWHGGSAALPPGLRAALHDDRQRALQGLQDCLAKQPEVRHHLTTAQQHVQEALQMFPLTPEQRTLLLNCAATLQRCDLQNPRFPLPL